MWTIILAVFALSALALLASSLNTLELRDGRPLPLSVMKPDLGAGGDAPSWMNAFMGAFRVFMIFMWVMVPFYIIYLIISKEARKRLLRDILMVMPILLILYFISNSQAGENTLEDISGRFGMQDAEEMQGNLDVPPLPEFQPPPPWVSTAASIALAVVLAALITISVIFIWRRARIKEDRSLIDIQSTARQALASIETGSDLSEVIQRCYLQMVQTLRETMGINRLKDMTPHEFEVVLEKRGLPREPVSQLTQLFEQVRYGHERPGPAEQRKAINCLTSIVSACERLKERDPASLSGQGRQL
jgi:hypothetical protein